LASVDGFDGGILPLGAYSDLMQTVLPNQTRTVDGRLREYLTAVPDPHWLDLFNAQYLITDKTGDEWRTISPGQDVFFDLQHPATIAPGQTAVVGYVPPFAANSLVLLAGERAGTILAVSGNEMWELTPQPIDDGLLRVEWPETAVLQSIALVAPPESEWQIRGLALVNDNSQTFQTLVPGQYRLLHSGDVKIYENLDVLPRAFITENWHWQQNAADSFSAMTVPAFDPRDLVMLTGTGENQMLGVSRGKATITRYEAEQVVIRVENTAPAVLVLTDAFYPGWTAALDGTAVPIYRADLLFRAALVPAGAHEVVFSFSSRSFANGRFLSIVGLLLGIFTGLLTTALPGNSKGQK
jgi:hypothetical protein